MDDEKPIAPPAPLKFSIESLWRGDISDGVRKLFVRMNKGLNKNKKSGEKDSEVE